MAKSGEKPEKKSAKKKQRKKVEQGNDVVLKLTELEMKDIALFEARKGMQAQVLLNIAQQMQLLSLEYKRQKAEYNAQAKSTRASQQEIDRDHNEFVAKVEKRLGIKLPEYTYDDSGVLTHNPIEEAPPPEEGQTAE